MASDAVLMCRHLSGSWTAAYLKPNRAVLSEVASGVMNTKTKGKVSLNLENRKVH